MSKNDADRSAAPRHALGEQRTGHRLTGLHLPATDLQGLQRKASDLHHRRVVAQHLLDRMGYELGMRAQIGQLIGMSK